jgi:hypothetical protein
MDKIPVFMTIEEWQNVLNILAEHPYKQVKNPIDSISGQVQQVIMARQMMPQPNGALVVKDGFRAEETGNA